MRIAALAVLGLAGCAPPPAIHAQPCREGLRVSCGGTSARLTLPSMAWEEAPDADPEAPVCTTILSEGVAWTLVAEGDLAAPPRIGILRDGAPPPVATLEGARARGIAAAAGRLFVYGDALWILEPDPGILRELPLPPALRARRLASRMGSGCGACLGPVLEILGTLLTPAGPDPGLVTLVSPPVRSP